MLRNLSVLLLMFMCLGWAQAPSQPSETVTPTEPVGTPIEPGSQTTTAQPVTNTNQGQRSPGSIFHSLLPLILIFAVLYLVMILPQQRRQKKHQQMLQALKRGDRVVLSSGILGIVSEVKDNTLLVKIAENTVIEIEKGSVAARSGSDK